MISFLKKIALVLLITSAVWSCKEDEKDPPVTPYSNVYQELQNQSNLSLYLQAVEIAGLTDELSADGITLLAPTDSAFNVYLKGLDIDNIEGLHQFYGHSIFQNFVLYHVLEKKVKTMDVVNSYLPTAATDDNGDKLHAYTSSVNKQVYINAYAGRIIEADMEVESSVIHKINGVLTPLTLNGLIRVNPSLSKLKTAISQTQDNLEVLLNQENQSYTIICPNDVAVNSFFTEHGYTTWADLKKEYGNPALGNLLRYHILNGAIKAADLSNGLYYPLLGGHYFEIIKDNSGTISIIDEKNSMPRPSITTTNIVAVNGTIHIADRVLEHH